MARSHGSRQRALGPISRGRSRKSPIGSRNRMGWAHTPYLAPGQSCISAANWSEPAIFNMKTNSLSHDQLQRIDAYWRKANYLSVGQIFLADNPLLKRPLALTDIKHMLIGHWGTGHSGPALAKADCFTELPSRLTRLASGSQWLHASRPRLHRPRHEQKSLRRARLSAANANGLPSSWITACAGHARGA